MPIFGRAINPSKLCAVFKCSKHDYCILHHFRQGNTRSCQQCKIALTEPIAREVTFVCDQKSWFQEAAIRLCPSWSQEAKLNLVKRTDQPTTTPSSRKKHHSSSTLSGLFAKQWNPDPFVSIPCKCDRTADQWKASWHLDQMTFPNFTWFLPKSVNYSPLNGLAVSSECCRANGEQTHIGSSFFKFHSCFCNRQSTSFVSTWTSCTFCQPTCSYAGVECMVFLIGQCHGNCSFRRWRWRDMRLKRRTVSLFPTTCSTLPLHARRQKQTSSLTNLSLF